MMWLLTVILNVAQAGNQNGKVQPYMKGAGVNASTIVYPSSFPITLPNIKTDIETADGVTTPNFNEFRQDLAIGGKGTLFISPKYRASVNPYAHFGFNNSNYRAYGANFEVDYMAFRERNVMGYYGGGVGTQMFSMTDGGSGSLNAAQNYLKAQAGVIYFEKRKAYELAAFAKLGKVTNETITVGGKTYEQGGFTGSDDQLTTSLYSPTFGLEGTLYFGDFRKMFKNNNPPKNKKNNPKKKGKKNGNKNGKKK